MVGAVLPCRFPDFSATVDGSISIHLVAVSFLPLRLITSAAISETGGIPKAFWHFGWWSAVFGQAGRLALSES